MQTRKRAGLVCLALGLPLLEGCPAPNVAPQGETIGLQGVATGLTAPVALVPAPDGSGRLFVVDLIGLIRVVEPGSGLRAAPLLDIRNRIIALNPTYDERGLLGMALHPQFTTNRRFFVVYSAPLGAGAPAGTDDEWRLSEFTASASDATVADAGTERILLSVPKPQFNHNGGQLAFGPDGMLYVSLGDGGGANDAGPGHNPAIGNAQDRSTLLGKLLRITVDGGAAYAIPADNPFVGVAGARPEIWALGLRNPWRFSFDTATGRLFLGDAGQDLFEEIDIIVRGGNYGWRVREGFACFDPDAPGSPPAACPSVGPAGEPLLDPILAFPHLNAEGQPLTVVVIGGYVYRGSALPALTGQYVFGQFSTTATQADGRILAAREQANGTWQERELQLEGEGRLGRFILAFGQDAAGEVYVLTTENLGPVGSTGVVFKLVAAQ
ncbi:MAG: PQQ-dependent sugar dehydrogenase [Planctomycetota bacterium]